MESPTKFPGSKLQAQIGGRTTLAAHRAGLRPATLSAVLRGQIPSPRWLRRLLTRNRISVRDWEPWLQERERLLAEGRRARGLATKGRKFPKVILYCPVCPGYRTEHRARETVEELLQDHRRPNGSYTAACSRHAAFCPSCRQHRHGSIFRLARQRTARRDDGSYMQECRHHTGLEYGRDNFKTSPPKSGRLLKRYRRRPPPPRTPAQLRRLGRGVTLAGILKHLEKLREEPAEDEGRRCPLCRRGVIGREWHLPCLRTQRTFQFRQKAGTGRHRPSWPPRDELLSPLVGPKKPGPKPEHHFERNCLFLLAHGAGVTLDKLAQVAGLGDRAAVKQAIDAAEALLPGGWDLVYQGQRANMHRQFWVPLPLTGRNHEQDIRRLHGVGMSTRNIARVTGATLAEVAKIARDLQKPTGPTRLARLAERYLARLPDNGDWVRQSIAMRTLGYRRWEVNRARANLKRQCLIETRPAKGRWPGPAVLEVRRRVAPTAPTMALEASA